VDERRNTPTPLWLARVVGPGRPEVGCDECFVLLDRYVELELAGEDAEASCPGMEAHFVGCPACGEEHELLLEYARGQDG
jgi:hypothetical protein